MANPLGKLIAEALEATLPRAARAAKAIPPGVAADARLASPMAKGGDMTKWLTPADPGYLTTGKLSDTADWDLNQIQPPAARQPVGTVMDPKQYGLPGIGDPLNDAVPAEGGELDLGTMIFNLVNKPDPSILAVTRLMDAGRADLVTPEIYANARKMDPDGLRAELTSRVPPNLQSNRYPLGMSERVFHYTDAGRGNLPGSPPFENFEPRRGGFNQTFDSLGPHVGTFDAADQRRSSKSSSGATTYVDPNYQLPGYTRDMHPDAAPYAVVPNDGSMMELAANLEKPFLYGDADALATEWGSPRAGWWKSYANENRNRWTEGHINSALDDMLASAPFPDDVLSREKRMAFLRQELARRGYTHVPYENAIEDAGSTSHVMLTDRPKGSDAVLRDRKAVFHPGLAHLPNLTAGIAGGGLSLGALLSGGREDRGF
jgi:hypothetical protein